MIRTEGGFTPGSPVPVHASSLDVFSLERDSKIIWDEYMSSAAWKKSLGLLVLGEAGSGKTTLGLLALKAVYRDTDKNPVYWTEKDFLDDLKQLWRHETLSGNAVRDDSAWAEYLEWERQFWNLKDAPLLFIDDIGRCYTGMQLYEVESLFRYREAKGLLTIVAAQTVLWTEMPAGMRSVVERNSVMLKTNYGG